MTAVNVFISKITVKKGVRKLPQETPLPLKGQGYG